MVWVVVGVCAVTLVAGFLFKGQCLKPWDGLQYSHLCYNDIMPLYSIRQVEAGTFPYVSASMEGTELVNGGIEYPVLTGVFMWFMGTFVSSNSNAYFVVTAIALAPFAILTAKWLAQMHGWRALMWAAAPAVVFYAFHNWDLLVVAAAVAGFWYWHREKRIGAAIAFGIGGALKMYPMLFLGPLLLERVKSKDAPGAAKIFGAGVGAFAVANLPFALVNFEGWWGTYEFHRLRGPNLDSIWYLKFPWLTPEQLNLVSGLLTLLTFVGVLVYGWRKSQQTGVYPVLQVSGALLAGFLLWNKVHSPQYTLWLLPFFVLLNVRIWWWVAYTIADALAYVGIFRFFHALQMGSGIEDLSYRLLAAGVYGRAALLAALIVVFLESERAPVDRAAEMSHPIRRVAPVGDQAPA